MLWICKWISCNSLGYSLDMPYMAGLSTDFMEKVDMPDMHHMTAQVNLMQYLGRNSLDVRYMTPVAQQPNPTHMRSHQRFQQGSSPAKG